MFYHIRVSFPRSIFFHLRHLAQLGGHDDRNAKPQVFPPPYHSLRYRETRSRTAWQPPPHQMPRYFAMSNFLKATYLSPTMIDRLAFAVTI